ncbi:MAG: hypothetical protein P8J75_11295 [Actinomycetota bacterium]|nr:hypothetical protein [Actinomycetota bacterium]
MSRVRRTSYSVTASLMFLWFAGTALVAMWFTFRDPAIDHRVVIFGSLLPDLVVGLSGSAWALHTLLAPIMLMSIFMLVTIGRRHRRRLVLALPVGMFWHLVFDGAWMNTQTFWWPITGLSFADASIPASGRSLNLVLLLECLGFVALCWAWRRMGLGNSVRRRLFIRTGRLDREITDPQTKSH